jgi:hypothetical protein
MTGRYILFILILIAALGIGAMTPECVNSAGGPLHSAGAPDSRPCHNSFITLGGHAFDSPLPAFMIFTSAAARFLPPRTWLAESAGETRLTPRPAAAQPQTPPPRPSAALQRPGLAS